VHPSQQYLIVLSNIGFYYIFNLEKGDLRGKVRIDAEATNLKVDQSGLYISYVSNQSGKVVLYELATGIKVYSFESGFKFISDVEFSSDYQSIVMSNGEKPGLKTFFFDQKLIQRMKQVGEMS